MILITLLLTGCVSLNTRLPEIQDSAVKAEQGAQEKIAFAEINRHRVRLDDVAHKVLQANADICEKSAQDIGVVTQTIKSFPKELRGGAAREIGLTEEPMIVFVRPGSPAEQAGLHVGDRLLNDEGEAVHAPGKSLTAHLKNGRPLKRSRLGDETDITMTGPVSCDYPARLKMSSAINAYANGKTITVTAGMMNFIRSDDELAYIIGHELAHNTQSHIRKSITNYILSLGGTRYTRPFEAEADYVGLYYMERAGFNSEGVEDLWRRLAKLSIRPIGRAKTHPAYPTRTVQIQATRDEIAAKRVSREVLHPELKAGRK